MSSIFASLLHFYLHSFEHLNWSKIYLFVSGLRTSTVILNSYLFLGKCLFSKCPFWNSFFFFEILCFENSFFSVELCIFSKHIQRTFKNVWSLNLKFQKWLLGVDVWSFYHFLNLPLNYILINFSTVITFRGGLKIQ